MDKQSNGKNGGKKVATFFKKNIYYILMFVCIAAIVTMITVAAVNAANRGNTPVVNPGGDTNKGDDNNGGNGGGTEPEEPTDKPFIIQLPVATETIGLDYAEDHLVFHPTTVTWKTHLGVDYIAPAGTEVKAVFDGKVKSIETDSYYGTVMTIEHKGGYTSVYKLLDKDTSVKVGANVKKGDTIGKIGNASTYEVKQGEHLHFELLKDGKNVNPNDYTAEGDK